MNLSSLKSLVEQKRGKFTQLQNEYDKTATTIADLELQTIDLDAAKLLMQTVAQQTQAQVEYFISDVVTSAEEAVFDDPYKFKTEFVLKRGKTECDLWFERDGMLIKPTDAAGGGTVDIASFGLRLSLWSLNKNRPVLILDEPFKHLSRNLHAKALEMLKEISDKLNIQIIMVSHSEELIEGADKVFRVEMKQGKSNVSVGVK